MRRGGRARTFQNVGNRRAPGREKKKREAEEKREMKRENQKIGKSKAKRKRRTSKTNLGEREGFLLEFVVSLGRKLGIALPTELNENTPGHYMDYVKETTRQRLLLDGTGN